MDDVTMSPTVTLAMIESTFSGVYPPIEWVSTKGKRRKKGKREGRGGIQTIFKPHLHKPN
jgi:hypothetical protein